MDLRIVAVRDRIADLQRTGAELRMERVVAARAVTRPPRPLGRLGAWLIGIGTALGGGALEASRPAIR